MFVRIDGHIEANIKKSRMKLVALKIRGAFSQSSALVVSALRIE